MKTIKVSDFSEYPGLRHCDISDDSGELFYHKILNSEFKKSFENKEKLNLILDGTAGYAPSFLDEAIGNLVYDFSILNVKKYLIITSIEEPNLIDSLEKETYIQWENRRIGKIEPKKTERHSSWWYLDDNGDLKNKTN